MTEFAQDLMDAQTRALDRDPTLGPEDLADSDEVTEVLDRWSRPVPVSSPSVAQRADIWAAKLLE